MGINNAHKLTFSISKIDVGQLVTIGNARLKEKQTSSPTFRRLIPSVDVDCSWVVRRQHRTAKYRARVGFLTRLSLALARAGFSVMLVCDGE
jgi:hypothetical protein